MYDNFDMNRCIIVEETYNNDDPANESAEVKFVAELRFRETNELTAFMETAQFERATKNGPWLYKNGTIEAVPKDDDDIDDIDDIDTDGDDDDDKKEEEEDIVSKLKEQL